MNSNFFQLVGLKDVSFMTVFESVYLGNVEFMRDIFVTICVAIIVFPLSLYGMWATEKKTDINSLTNQYYEKIRIEKALEEFSKQNGSEDSSVNVNDK